MQNGADQNVIRFLGKENRMCLKSETAKPRRTLVHHKPDAGKAREQVEYPLKPSVIRFGMIGAKVPLSVIPTA